MNFTQTMTSSRPYLIRAIYEWIVDNNLTPYIAIDTSVAKTTIPQEYIEGDHVILDVSPAATSNLIISNEFIEFKARFNGENHAILIPIAAIAIIYAKENNQGMTFSPEDDETDLTEDHIQQTTPSPQKSRTHLKLITNKSNNDD